MIRLSSARMIVRNFISDDWRDLQEITIDKTSSPYAFFDYPVPTGEREVKELANWFSQQDSYLAVFETSEKKVIGYLAINTENHLEYNLGYDFLSSYQKKGYATEACIAIINYVFGALKADKFSTGTAALNTPSRRLLGKLGFKKTSEAITSFQKTPEGKAIEFLGVSFELTRDAWLKTDYAITQ
jgi:[ribosomal protein S5]-alanine N-acetyltransferase